MEVLEKGLKAGFNKGDERDMGMDVFFVKTYASNLGTVDVADGYWTALAETFSYLGSLVAKYGYLTNIASNRTGEARKLGSRV